MGSSSSKSNAAADSPSPSPPPSSIAATARSGRSRVFQSSCLRSIDSDGDGSQIPKHQSEGNCSTTPTADENETGGEKNECYENVKAEQPDENHVNSDVELDEWHQSRFYDTVSRVGNSSSSSSSRAFSSRSSNLLNRFLPRLSFTPGNISFRLSRANDLEGQGAPSASSRSFVLSNDEDDLHLQSCSSGRFVNKSERSRSCDFFPVCFGNGSPTENQDFASNNGDNSLQNQHIASDQGLVRDNNDTIVDSDINLLSPESYADGIETRLSDRRSAPRAPDERNIQFSRTLSVGRLRGRVLRRSPFPEFRPFHREMEVRRASEGSRRQDLVGGIRQAISEDNDSITPSYSGHASSGASNSVYRILHHEVSRATYTIYHELLDHRSSFSERRRRIRSQVRALRRLRSRFENFSGHTRSCILSGQHRSGNCTCRRSTQANSENHNSIRASISRNLMLAEALLAQSVVLSSQPSVSSIGSLPAPNDVVESLPVKTYNKSQNDLSEDAARCYICLVDYEDGDNLRILPCHHDFHRTCVDKWLKEIHRVCPLCRGDVCRSNLFGAGSDPLL
ncbi:cell wall protein RBR3 [Ipomoea triloba]|uniref:cell wall protein RBR3 n=1 Tax=Ipomoea triloba TaxID=35885 RepID=UPI00125DC807|nr:cell wall protein RBR3 [Ipomoea triloba]